MNENQQSSQQQQPDFDSIRQVNEGGLEYWSARDLASLLGYDTWQRFESAIKRAMIACEQVGQAVNDHISGAANMIVVGKGAKRQVKDYLLSRFGAYLTAQNGDPRKPEIAAAQAYFAVSTRENEVAYQMLEEQNERVSTRQLMDEGNRELEQVARQAGVLPRSFGLFHRAGYEGLYGGIGPEEIKLLKGVEPKEDLLDRMGSEELANNSFRAFQTSAKLRRDGVNSQAKAIETHREVGQEIRGLIEKIGGTLPEELPAEPSIKPVLKSRRRRKDLPAAPSTSDPEQG